MSSGTLVSSSPQHQRVRLHRSAEQVDRSSHAQPTENSGKPILGPSGWFDAYGDYLHNFARLRLRNFDAADEVVQETLLGGLQSFHQFRRQATELDWLMGILRNKIADYARRKVRSRHDQLHDQSTLNKKNFIGLSLPVDCSAWSANPTDEAEREEFWAIIEEALEDMPDGPGAAFRLSVIECCDAAEICQILSITNSNLWVRLHRARAYLADRLNERWNQPAA